MKEQYIPWIISGLMLLITVIDKVLSRRKARIDKEAATERRVQELEVNRQIDQAKLDAELRVIKQQVAQATTAAGQANQLIKTALSNHE